MARLPSGRGPGERGDLSVPKGAPVRGSLYDADAFGRFSEALARFLGTGKYLFGQTVFVIVWITLNGLLFVHHWDPYPFILLNLAFSTQAAYAAPLILLAQNRQDERDRATTERDRQVAARTQADTEYLARELATIRLALNDVVTNQDLAEHLERLAKLVADRSPEKPDEDLPARLAQHVDRTEAAGDGMTARAAGASRDGPVLAAGVVSDAEGVPGAACLAGDDATAVLVNAAGVAALAAGVTEREALAAGVAGAARAPAPYIQVPVDWTEPGLSVIPETVAWCPWASVSRTVNGPWPAPDAAIQ
jgi:uncharacterized membrane protein